MAAVGNSVRIFAPGGAAINIVGDLYKQMLTQDKQVGLANTQITFLDTSHSMVEDWMKEEDFYFVEPDVPEGTVRREGSGKERSKNISAAINEAPRILHKYPVGKLAIIVHSTSGGSGSSIGPALADELLRNTDEDVVIFLVGSTTSKKEIYNAIRVIQGYQNMVKNYARPVNIVYLENSPTHTQEMNDSAARVAIIQLLTFWSGENQRIDDSDLHHFLNYTKVTDYPAALTALQFFVGEAVKVNERQPVPAILTLSVRGQETEPGMTVGYHSYGYLPEAAAEYFKTIQFPIHVASVQGYFNSVVERLQKIHDSAADPRVNQVEAIDVSKGKTVGNTSILL